MRSLLVPVLLLTAACQAETTSTGTTGDGTPPAATATAPEFQFDMTRADALSITVRDGAGQPLDKVRIVVREGGTLADDGVTIPGNVLYTGLTGADGRCQDRLDHTLDLTKVEVTLLRPGYTGRYDDPSRREAYRELAPAAWFSATPAELSSITVDLTSTEVK